MPRSRLILLDHLTSSHYGETSLLRTPLGQLNMSSLKRCPYFKMSSLETGVLFQRYFYTLLYVRSWDNRQCPDWRGDLITEVLNKEVPPDMYTHMHSPTLPPPHTHITLTMHTLYAQKTDVPEWPRRVNSYVSNKTIITQFDRINVLCTSL